MATGDPHTKFRADRSSGSRDMLADRQTDADRQAGHNTPHPYRGGVIMFVNNKSVGISLSA